MSNDRLLTVKEAAELLSVHPNTVYKLVEAGRIPAIRRNGIGIRFKRENLDRWLEQGSQKYSALFESLPKFDIALSEYDKLFLKQNGGNMGSKGKVWHYPFGSVYLRLTKTGKERWYIYYRINGERIRECVKNAQSRSDALKVLQLKIVDAFRGEHGFQKQKRRKKFLEFAAEYIENYAKINKRSWRDDVSGIKKISQIIGNPYLDEISSYKIEKFKSKRLSNGIAQSSVNRNLALLKTMFNLAIDWGYCKENPVLKVKFFSEKDNIKERILSRHEEQKLLESCSEHLKPIVLTALHTGMRKGEILNLSWPKVDLKKRVIRVEKTKSGKIRLIPINASLFKELALLRVLNAKSDYLFLNPMTGQPMQDIKTAFRGAVRRSGIEGLRFHDLRHTFASRLIESGVDIVTVQNLLGHYSVVVTQRYTHSSAEQKRKAVENLTKSEHKTTDFVHSVSTRKRIMGENAVFSIN